MMFCDCEKLLKGIYKVENYFEECVKDLQYLILFIWSGKIGIVFYICVYRFCVFRILWWMFNYSYDYYILVIKVVENKFIIIYYVFKVILWIIMLKGVVEII